MNPGAMPVDEFLAACRAGENARVAAALDAGSTREASFNRWGEPPEALASERVAAFLSATLGD